MRCAPLLLLLLVACRAPDLDVDRDGVMEPEDCNDADANVLPGTEELCNGVDDNCDGLVDEAAADAPTWYADADNDGFGDPETALRACSGPRGYVADATDCDDSASDTHPGADEACTAQQDTNCDGVLSFEDADGDGFAACEDCDDAVADVFPGAQERCNGRDDSCDGAVDELGAVGAPTWYADGDGDGFGGADTTQAACAAPPDYVATATDCDDGDDTVFPGGDELCNGRDDDCDGAVDEAGALGAPTWYADADDDGAGDAADTVDACVLPLGYVASAGDCDPARGDVYPGAVELCDGVDQDCDGVVDDGAVDASTWFADADRDTYGDASTATTACAAPPGYVADSGDCNDAAISVHPLAVEGCNGLDDNCDGQLPAIEADSDGDGVATCEGDCNDGDPAVAPGVPERCNSIDDDCDGVVDGVNAVDKLTWYLDSDRDGHGGPNAISACKQPSGYLATSTDCDDSASTVHPGAVESCNAVDDDCSGRVDEGLLGTASACAATDCAQLLALRPGLGDGAYWIDSRHQAAPYRAWCDMTTDGGGWTLALKADGTKSTFAYANARWENTALLGETVVSIDRVEAKYESFVSLPFSELLLGMETPIQPSGPPSMRVLPIAHSADSLRSVLRGGAYTAFDVAPGRTAWKGLIAGSSLQANCDRQGFNAVATTSAIDTRIRIGILGNQENNCASPDSRLGVGGAGTACGQAGANSVGNTARCSADNGDVDLRSFAWLFARCTDAPDLVGDGRDTNCDLVDGEDLDGDGFASVASGGTDCDDTDRYVTPTNGCG